MPKIKQQPQDDDDDGFIDEEEEFDEDREEEDEEAPIPATNKGKKPVFGIGQRMAKPNTTKDTTATTQQPTRQVSPSHEIAPKPVIKRRFGVMPAIPSRIIDIEANEIVGEGEYAIMQTLADILERLERIEDNIGSIIQQ